MSCLRSGPTIDAPPGGYYAPPSSRPRWGDYTAAVDALHARYYAEKPMRQTGPHHPPTPVPKSLFLYQAAIALRDAVAAHGKPTGPNAIYGPPVFYDPPSQGTPDSERERLSEEFYAQMLRWAGTDVIPSRPVAPVVHVVTEAHMAHARHMEDCRKRDVLITRHGLTPSDAEAVLAHLTWTRLGCSFRKDTLAALRAIGDFARANGIRVRDAEQVLQEVAGPRPPPVREEPLDQSPSLSLAAGGSAAASAVRKAIPKKIRGEAWKAQFGSSTEGSCYCCRKELDIFDDWHAGHIVPAARGGPDTADNLRPLCGSCNLAMGTEHMDLFKARCYHA
jgi:hypothetical protein